MNHLYIVTVTYRLMFIRVFVQSVDNSHALGLGDAVNLNHIAEMVRKQRTASINEFEISHDGITNTWLVTGSGLQRFVQMTNWRYVCLL